MNDIMKPLVSVIIPMYNRENTILRAVESVLNQTYSNLELIIVDDGSTDMSVKIVEKYLDQRVRLITLPHNSGANTARNIGIKNAKGHYIALQDSDDEWLSDKLMVQMEYMLNKRYKVLFCSYMLYLQENDVQQVPSLYKIQEIKEKGINSILRRENIVSTQTLVIEKEVIKSVGLFNEMMPRLQDYEYIIRIAQKYDIGFVEQPLVNVYRQADGISNNISAFYNAIEILIEKHSAFLDIESLLQNSMPLNAMIYDEKFGEAVKRLRQLYAKENREKERHFNDIIINILGKKYIDAKRKDKIFVESRISQLREKEFAIYGSGIIAKRIYYMLKQKELYPNCFIVSNKTKNTEEYIDNIPVKEISNIKNKNIEIIVAVSIKYQEEILDNLSKWNFDKYFILDNTKI